MQPEDKEMRDLIEECFGDLVPLHELFPNAGYSEITPGFLEVQPLPRSDGETNS
jgi:hypothetical protein